MLNYVAEDAEKPDIVVEIVNVDQAIVVSRGKESFRLSFDEFDEVLEAVARCETFKG